MTNRQTLREVLTLDFLNAIPTGTEFERFVQLVQDSVPARLQYDVLEDSLRHVAGTRLTPEVIDAVSWRIVGNLQRLRERRVVPPWHVQKLPEWVPTQIVSCRRQANVKDERGAMFGFRILAGTPASLTTYKWWRLRFIRYLSKDFGYTRPRGAHAARYPYTHPEQIVGMRIFVRIEPKLCEREPGFSQVAFSSSVTTWNRDLIRCRFRTLPGFTCPIGRGLDAPCHQCPIGFLKCRAATHRQDWVKKQCPDCDKEAWFDPEMQSPRCIDCTMTYAYRKKS